MVGHRNFACPTGPTTGGGLGGARIFVVLGNRALPRGESKILQKKEIKNRV